MVELEVRGQLMVEWFGHMLEVAWYRLLVKIGSYIAALQVLPLRR